MDGEQHDAGPRKIGAQALEGLEAAEAGHRDVEDDDVGANALDELEHLAAVGRFAGDLEVRLGLEQSAQAFAHDAVVVCDHDRDHRSRVPAWISAINPPSKRG